MPYNTRRKSLSLPSLGIQLPSASRSHRPSISKPSPPQLSPPAKKVKRSHHSSTSSTPSSPTSPSRSRTTSITKNVSFAERPKSSGRAAYEHTPPPSPGGPSTRSKVDTEGINDDIVVGVIEQLEKTGNRPHLIKELAMVLSTVSDAVSTYTHPFPILTQGAMLTINSSANPGALLSSRLSAYMKRPRWSALSPCPLDKELTTVHPRKVYFFLTTSPRQEIPADSSDIINDAAAGTKGKRVISPSISNASVDGDAEAAEERKREALSPSPEVDLSVHDVGIGAKDAAPEFVPPGTPAASSYSGRSSLARDGSNASQAENRLSHSHRAASPPLETDEKEFTQTASSMRMRGMSLDDPTVRPSTEELCDLVIEESEEQVARRNREAAEALFGAHQPQAMGGMPIMSSPMVKPSQPAPLERASKREEGDVVMQESTTSILGESAMGGLTWDTREPEDIQIEDLDDLFGAY